MELFGRRVVIGAAEMLVAREDLEEEPEGVTDRRPLGLAERIAALRWGSATPIQLVLGASRAGCTPEEELALWAMTVLGRGTIDDVRALHRGAPGREGLGCSRPRVALLWAFPPAKRASPRFPCPLGR